MKIENENWIEPAANNDKPLIKGSVSTSFDAAIKKTEDKFHKSVRAKEAGYEKPDAGNSALDEVKQEFSDKMDATLRKNQMAVLSNTVSPEDYQKMQEEGFPVGDTDTGTIITVTEKIKVQLAKAGVDVSHMGDEMTQEQLEEIGGSLSAALQLAQKMQGADIPATPENLEDGVKAINQAEELGELNQGAVKYMLDNHLPPTVENIYTAQHCGSDAYTTPEEQDIDFDAIRNQMKQVIEEAGYQANEKTYADSAWMIENDIPFTAENFAYMQELEGMSLPVSADEAAEAVTLALAEGSRPKDAMLILDYSLTAQAAKAVEIVTEATDEDLAYLIGSGQELTIENLKKAIEARKAGRVDKNQNVNPSPNVQSQTNAGAVTEASTQELALLVARRQLEETRLAMTTEANLALLKQGISIDTKPLEELVAQLKGQEENYYAALLGENGEVNDALAEVFEETSRKVADLKTVPAYTLGMTGYDMDTVNGLHEAGTALKDTFEKANQSYETLMTSPRKDLGDSIQKAFGNVDDILGDLGLERSEANRRAVRILAYNNLEINEASIISMKAADEKVQRTFSNLTPATVKEMIAQGINPLDMNLDKLNRKAAEIRTQVGESDEKFSEYLWKLEQNNEISKDERESYVGIYRLINQIDKTDGAVIGALVNQGGDLTMRNLLTAMRSSKKSGMEYAVDDNFEGVDSVSGNYKSITDQIDTAYQQNCVQDILEALTPVTFRKLIENPDWDSSTPEQIKEEIERLTVQEADKESIQSREYAKAQLENFNTAAISEREVYRMLSDYNLPNTVNNVLAAGRLLHQRNTVFSRLFNSDETFDGDAVDFKAIEDKILEDFSDALESPESLAEAQKALADTAENVMKTMIKDDKHITSMDIREMKLTCTQLSIAGRMAEEENYAIPVLVGDEVTNLSLKIIRGKDKKGFVDIMFASRLTGKVAASFEARKNAISGVAATDNQKTKELLEENAEKLTEQMNKSEGEANVHFSAIYTDDLSLEQFASNAEKSHTKAEKQDDDSEIMTEQLYGIAKSFIETVKELAKKSDI